MIHPQRQQNMWALPAGTVIRVRHGLYDYVAMLGDRAISGGRSVVACSPQTGGFVEQIFTAFAGGRAVVIEDYLGSLPPSVVMQRARMKQGQVYSWSDFNCEHFVRYAHGVPALGGKMRRALALSAGETGLLSL